MKQLKAIASCLLFSIFCLHSSAQDTKAIPINEPDYNKPRILDDLPAKMTLNEVEVIKLFSLDAGGTATVMLTNEFLVKATVISNGMPGPDVQTIVLRITNRNNAILTLTRTRKPGAVSYGGRMMSRDNGDALVLKKENGINYFQKINLYDLISE